MRHGGGRRPLGDLRDQVMRVADLRVRMSWQDHARGGTIVYGARRPDSLLDIIDIVQGDTNLNMAAGGNGNAGHSGGFAEENERRRVVPSYMSSLTTSLSVGFSFSQ